MLKVYNLNIASIFPYLHASLEINELGKSSTALQKLGPSISTSELGRHEHFWDIGLTYGHGLGQKRNFGHLQSLIKSQIRTRIKSTFL